MATPVPPPEKPTVSQPEKVHYLNLPCPVPYEDIHREAMIALRPELFDGFRVDLSNKSIKDLQLVKVTTDGVLIARTISKLSSNITLNVAAHIVNQPNMSSCKGHIEYQGKSFMSQFEIGSGGSYGANYIQRISQNVSLGGEAFWLGQQGQSEVNFAARYENEDKNVAVGQVSSSGMVVLSYFQKLSEKLGIASEFMLNYLSRDVVASVGYVFSGQNRRVRGKVDSNGKVYGYLEEDLNAGLKFVLSAEIDHLKKDHKFGFGLSSGQ
ncbi:hypothetical protein ACH5RR_036616 [Cinchona calisaya]|uniref:Uncharacterized protein n=1 Tax=Cinchona calisaya TaxID=153742 RepID=A0ABD2Y3P9_9GENT